MTDLNPSPVLSSVPQLEVNTLALGGTGNPMNLQAQALLNRTAYLLQQIQELEDRIQGIEFTPKNLGAIGDGIADDTVPVLAWAASPVTSSKKWGDGTYRTTQDVVFNVGDQVEGNGADNSILDCSGGIGGATECVRWTGLLTPLPALAASVDIQSNVLQFVSNPNLSLGDVILIWNPTDFSWSQWREDYRAGEWLRVAMVDTNNITVFGLTYDSYLPADVQLYKLSGKQSTARDFRIKQPATSNAGLKMTFIDGPIVENVVTGGGIYAGIYIDKCVDMKIHSRATQASSPAAGNNYGLVIGNSQGGSITGEYFGTRHAVSLGGAPGVGSVSTRGLIISANMKNLGPIQAQDLHGNTEDIKFVGGTFTNGGVIAGKNNKWIGCVFQGKTNSGIALLMGEVKGGTFELSGCRAETTVNPNPSSQGIISLLNFTSAIVEDASFIFSDFSIRAPAGTLYPFYIGFNGTTGNHSLIVNGVNILGGPNLDRLVRLRNFVAGGTYKLVQISGLNGEPSTGFSYVTEEGSPTVTKYKLPAQRGLASIPVTTANSVFTSVVTFGHAYPASRAPRLLTGNTNPTLGGKRVTPGYQSLTANGFLATIATTDLANFGSSATGAVEWSAQLEEL